MDYPFSYPYSRERLPNGRWDINNPNRSTTLAEDIEAALPTAEFVLKCLSGTCTISFTVELTPEEKTTLDTTVANHKANT